MAQRSSKHSEVQTIDAGFDGGLNLYDGSSGISDNQMVDCCNFFYAEEGDELVTRPGVKLVSRVKIGEVLLTVVLHPAQGGWRLVGSSEWLASGVSRSLPAGVAYELEFQDVDGYRTPGGSTVTLVEDTVIDAYYRFLYSLIINLGLPDEVINPAVAVAGVTAQPDSTRAQRKFKAVSDEYDITYGGVSGYIKPDDESYNLVEDSAIDRNYYKDTLELGFGGMAYGNGVYVATREREVSGGYFVGDVYVSSDGIHWDKSYTFSATTTVYKNCLPSVVFGNGIFVWVGKTEGRHIAATSADGVNWTERVSIASGLSGFSDAVNFSNGKFFTSVANYQGIWNSADGISWSHFSAYNSIYQTKYFGSKYFFSYPSGYYLTSSDLANLTSTMGGMPAGGVVFDFEVHAGMIFTAKKLTSTGKGQFFHSVDGSSWMAIPCSLQFLETRRFIRTPNYWFMSCDFTGMTDTTPSIYRSVDLQEWSVVPAAYGAVGGFRAFNPQGNTRFYNLNGRLFVSDPYASRTLIIQDV